MIELKTIVCRTGESFWSRMDKLVVILRSPDLPLATDHWPRLDFSGLEWAGKEKEYEIQLELTAAQRAEFEVEAAQARQEARDALEDARIADRRIASVTHDLRRQLRAERRYSRIRLYHPRDISSSRIYWPFSTGIEFLH